MTLDQYWKLSDRAKRKTVIEAMRRFRKTHPEYNRVRVLHHGWAGWSVWADYCHENTCVARMEDVIRDYTSSEAYKREQETAIAMNPF